MKSHTHIFTDVLLATGQATDHAFFMAVTNPHLYTCPDYMP